MHEHEGTAHLLPPHPKKEHKEIEKRSKIPFKRNTYIHVLQACLHRWFTATTTDIILGLLDYSEEYIQYNHHLSASAGGCKNGCPCSKPGNKFSQRCIISEKSKKKIERIELLPKSRSAGIVEFWPFGHMCSCRLHRQFRVERNVFPLSKLVNNRNIFLSTNTKLKSEERLN